MDSTDLLNQRLRNQCLEGHLFSQPSEAVAWFGAVQSQDFAGAAWAVSQRSTKPTLDVFNKAFARGDVLRTHVMRPTWHFVIPEDIRWMLDLSRERLLKLTAYYYRQFELDDKTLAKTDQVICQALANGQHLTRSELADILTQAGIDVRDGVRLGHIVGHAETLALICSGTPKGKQQTYALLEQRAPGAKTLDRETALAELAQRYFRSHGPATVEDFAWWAGITKKESQEAVHDLQHLLEHVDLDGTTYWFARDTSPVPVHQRAHLLPNYDEYIVAYTQRDNLFDSRHTAFLDSRQNPLFNNVLILDGVMAGTWKKTIRSTSLNLELNLFRAITNDERRDIHVAAKQYAIHLGLPELHIAGL